MKVHILDDWFDTLSSLPCFDKLDGHDVTVWTDHVENSSILADRLQEADCLVLFRERTRITEELLNKLPNLKLISQRSVYPHIDVSACTQNGVLLCSNMHSDTPSYAAAELTLAVMLSSFRQIPEQVASIRRGNWQMGVGRTLRGRTLGLYGYGRIAKAVATYAQAIGMNVQWWSSENGRERARTDGVQLAESREIFFSTSDIVSLHVRLKPETRGIITEQDLASMKPRSLLVNTSRSGLIAPGNLETEIAKGRIFAAVDVFDSEPLTDIDNPLLTSPNVLPTPHIGYVTEDEFDLQFSDIFDQIVAYAENKPIHMINPEVWIS
ncbi:D-2-hydroxyacid dehydrogenase family protein [uncultured Roseibium sp.]|uniref:D-2-hydroxyacid dehydrogenase family protein n=1 Tax=uncultured Roseibium sp. TaxID=1936171 RepID=UPI0026117C88|nr:D-2-hydroxyacid dehydrogenase family protein [uncultured Roseibium sp.]